jgi:hypothetical protein
MQDAYFLDGRCLHFFEGTFGLEEIVEARSDPSASWSSPSTGLRMQMQGLASAFRLARAADDDVHVTSEFGKHAHEPLDRHFPEIPAQQS